MMKDRDQFHGPNMSSSLEKKVTSILATALYSRLFLYCAEKKEIECFINSVKAFTLMDRSQYPNHSSSAATTTTSYWNTTIEGGEQKHEGKKWVLEEESVTAARGNGTSMVRS
jgi:hypothetical protein